MRDCLLRKINFANYLPLVEGGIRLDARQKNLIRKFTDILGVIRVANNGKIKVL